VAYGEIQGKTWDSPSIRGLQDSSKLAFAYLLSNKHSNMLGYYSLPLAYMARDLEWSIEKAKKHLVFLERRGVTVYDELSEIVFLPKYLKYNRLSTGKREAGAIDRLKNLRESSLLIRLKAAVDEWHPQLKELRSYLVLQEEERSLLRVLEDSSKSHRGVLDTVIDRDVVIDKEKERPKDGETYVTKKGRVLSGQLLAQFEEFWEVFALKEGRSAAADSWYDIKRLDQSLFDKILAGAQREAARRPGLRKNGRTPKYAQGWLTERRWEDELPDERDPGTIYAEKILAKGPPKEENTDGE